MTERCQYEEDEEDDGEECAGADEVFDADPGPDDGAYAAQNAAQNRLFHGKYKCIDS